MKKQLIRLMLASGITLFAGTLIVSAYPKQKSYIQNDLLSEYEQKLTSIEKQFADFKKQIEPDKMSKMDVKMKIGGFENNRNALKARMRDLRRTNVKLSETDKGDLDKKFEKLIADFEELKKLSD
jgi:septal ring factor EnvC (AmiA/AmiB activator)